MDKDTSLKNSLQDRYPIKVCLIAKLRNNMKTKRDTPAHHLGKRVVIEIIFDKLKNI